MLTFIEETIDSLKQHHEDLSSVIIILPSKRAGGFFKNHLKETGNTTSFAPLIISIEEFIEELSGLQIIDSTELIFKSYEAYLKTDAFREKEDFEIYTTWISTLLNDFNEIDRYLVDPEPFFSYLGSIKTLEKWNVKDEQTPLIKKYLTFWDNLYRFYKTLKSDLIEQNIAYQGLVYRKASENSETYATSKGHIPHAFIGFNALNAAEQNIIQALLETKNSHIYWDLDAHFYNDPKHSTSLFIRKYLSEWNYYKEKNQLSFPQNYTGQKQIRTIEVQKNIGQAKYIGKILETYSQEELNQTAIVLADENLLLPVLHSIPAHVTSINITMGVPLRSVPTTVFFELLLSLHSASSQTYYYKDVLSLLNHPTGHLLLPNTAAVVAQIIKDNTTHITLEYLLTYVEESDHDIIKILFSNWDNHSNKALLQITSLLAVLKNNSEKNTIQKVVLFQLHEIFEKIAALNNGYPHLKSVKTIQSLFVELIASITIDFKGDAYNGLQIMGVLETRVLDFKNVIVASVNEGILPSGKSNSSFITYDLKKAFNLPLYTEKDAIYTYHFYRLLQRASNVVLLYNNHSEGINTGEKSRFLLQMEIENLPNHTLTKEILSPKITVSTKELKQIEKTESVLLRLKEIAGKKFSPSSLTSYIRNPLDFYFQKVLKLNETEEVEETVAANTLGTIVHESLEALYSPFLNKQLTTESLKSIKANIEEEVNKKFIKHFKGGVYTKGKNLLIFEVAKRYISNFIAFEIRCIEAGDTIKLISLEKDLRVPLPIPQLDFPVYLGGSVDRVDEYNGITRIIDYKTGTVNQGDLEIVDWQDLTLDYKYSKAFQVLAYATMMEDEINKTTCEAGIISFKNLQNGFLKFATKAAPRSRTKEVIITAETVENYKIELKKLIVEICNPEIPFTEKDIE